MTGLLLAASPAVSMLWGGINLPWHNNQYISVIHTSTADLEYLRGGGLEMNLVNVRLL